MSLASIILKLHGWTIDPCIEAEDKCVVVVAPHTSNWDLLIGKLGYAALGRQSSFLMKKEWFFWPLSPIWKWMGGFPVDRQKHTSLTDQMVEAFQTRDYFNLSITPEATRKPNADWKKGFYYIAQAAGVPIHLAYLDYTNKRVGVGKRILITTQTADEVLQEVKEFYNAEMAKHPAQFKI